MITEYNQELIDKIENDNSVFPNTEAFSVHWLGGTGGAFLRSLTILYLYNLDSQYFIDNLSEYNNSHDSVKPEYFNWDPKSHEGIFQGHVSWLPPRHRYISPLDITKPVVLQDHTEPDYDTFWKRWPKGKILTISVRIQDKYELWFNMWWKTTAENFKLLDTATVNQYKSLQERTPKIFQKYNSPADISNDDLIRYFFGSLEEFENYEVPNDINGLPDFYNLDKSVPENIKDKILRIPYYKLTRNPEYTMKLLSEFLGRETNDNVRKFYYTYIERQNKLIEKHGPWLRDPSKPWSIPV